jgi:hypothetical protein
VIRCSRKIIEIANSSNIQNETEHKHLKSINEQPSTHLIRVPQEEGDTEKVYETIMAKTFPNLKKIEAQ